MLQANSIPKACVSVVLVVQPTSSDPQEAQSKVCSSFNRAKAQEKFSEKEEEANDKVNSNLKGQKEEFQRDHGGQLAPSLAAAVSGTDMQEGSFLKRGILSLITPK